MGSGELIELVIFDCDGVLVDSEKLAVEIDRRVLADLGWEIEIEEIVHRFVGRSDAHFRSEVERHLGRSQSDDWDAPYRSWYLDVFERELEAVPDIVAALDAIDIPVCVASSRAHTKIRTNLSRTGLLPRFEGRVFSADDVAEASRRRSVPPRSGADRRSAVALRRDRGQPFRRAGRARGRHAIVRLRRRTHARRVAGGRGNDGLHRYGGASGPSGDAPSMAQVRAR